MFIKVLSTKFPILPLTQSTSSPADYDKFLELLFKMLEYDPAKRVTPLEALRDQFFTKAESRWDFLTRARS